MNALIAANPVIPMMLTSLEAEIQRVQTYLSEDSISELLDMVNYHFGWEQSDQSKTGKRIRPLLTLLCCQGTGGDWQQALPAAASIEIIHNFSLIHDDIEDVSKLRRGRPAVWVKWGVAQAINTGDTIFVLARLLAQSNPTNSLPAEIRLEILKSIDQACLELTIGQHLDIAFEHTDHVSQDAYLRMISGKTAALLAASCQVGAQISNTVPSHRQACYDYGYHLGIAFQMIDDVLGIWGDLHATGKHTGDDIKALKKTLPVILGIEKSTIFKELWHPDHARTISADQIETMVAALDEKSIRKQVTELARLHTEQALIALQAAKLHKPATDIFLEIAETLLYREK